MRMPKGQTERWRKKYRGRVLYFRGSYAVALLAWQQKQLDIDGEDKTNYEQAILKREEITCAMLCIDAALSPEATAALAELPTIEQLEAVMGKGGRLPSLEKKVIDPWLSLPLADKEMLRVGFDLWKSTYDKPKATATLVADTIGAAIDEWTAGKKASVIVGRLRQATLSATMNNISVFRRWIKDDTPIVAINEATLQNFFNYLAGEVAAGRKTLGYFHQIMVYTKAFIRSQWEMHRIELPRNIASRALSVPVPDPDIHTLTIDELRAFYNRATGVLKTCMLLSLNCGFNQIDIATLKHTDIDWQVGTITKKRVKTSKSKNAPTITWRLWDTTLEQLKKHRSKHPELVLLGRKGAELMQGGGLERQDAVGRAWRYVRGKLGSKAEYKLLRKTAASMLGSHPVYGRYAQYFLGHAPGSVADKHYVKPDQEQFDQAVAWLGEQFKL
jgi:integrase